MDRKLMCVSNVRYRKPSQGEGSRMKNLLKYLTYRESRYETARYISGKERWNDHGMGGSVKEIADRCLAYQSEHVLLFSLVINPNPDLIHMVPEAQREEFVQLLTERVVNGFFDARGIDTGVEWSSVLHHRQTDGTESPDRHNPHTHIILPGTYYDADEGRRKNLYFSKNREVNHIDMLHDITQEQMANLMDIYAGRDWEQRYDQLSDIREGQKAIMFQQASHDDHAELGSIWAGVRRIDDDHSMSGVYGYFRNREGKVTAQFLPIGMDERLKLEHEEAEQQAENLRLFLLREKREREQKLQNHDFSDGYTSEIDF